MDIDGATDDGVNAALVRDGFVFVTGETMRAQLSAIGPLTDWVAFAASWDDLALDTYLADYGRYRRRRHAVFRVTRARTGAAAIARAAHQPHFQSREYNALQGGIERWFRADRTRGRRWRSTYARSSNSVVRRSARSRRRWTRGTSKRTSSASRRAPMRRVSPRPKACIATASTTCSCCSSIVSISRAARRRSMPRRTGACSAVSRSLVRSTRHSSTTRALFHGVTPVEPLDAARPAHRDVLVVTFKRESG